MFELMVFFCVYELQMMDLEEPISKMKVIHVAGTKGKVAVSRFFYVTVVAYFSNGIELLRFVPRAV